MAVGQKGALPGREPATVVKTRRLLNRWSLFAVIVLSAGAIVLFVSNAIAVNKLVERIDDRQSVLEKLQRENDRLRAESIHLQSPDRVSAFARDKLGMVQAASAPRKLK